MSFLLWEMVERTVFLKHLFGGKSLTIFLSSNKKVDHGPDKEFKS